jgi:deoxyribodipyrimidine photolyase-related protein
VSHEEAENMSTGILFPHQLFEDNVLISKCETLYLVEEYLFFGQYKFHKQKIAFHRASMKGYASYLQGKGIEVHYIEAIDPLSDVRKLIPFLKEKGVNSLVYLDTTDDWLEQRLHTACKAQQVELTQYPTPMFLNSAAEIAAYFVGKKRMFQTDFYKHQRLRRKILLESDQKPIGGKWSFDEENRLKYAKGKTPPKTEFLPSNAIYEEAFAYTQTHFADHYGQLNPNFRYPTTFAESKIGSGSFFIRNSQNLVPTKMPSSPKSTFCTTVS